METDTREQPPAGSSRNTPKLVAAVALTLAVVVVGMIALNQGSSDTAPLELSAGDGGTTTASCIAFSTEELARVGEIAFEGTVTSAEGAVVTLSVDRWFKGGEAAEVVLNAPQGMEALIGGIPFEVGEQYLITAQNGTVNYCGFSGPSTPEYRAAFETAFAG